MIFLDDNDILSILPNRKLNLKEISHPIKSLEVLKDKNIGKIMTFQMHPYVSFRIEP